MCRLGSILGVGGIESQTKLVWLDKVGYGNEMLGELDKLSRLG
jgi:hypothetical protein